ncbi:lysylphosphatidylglycerol synthase transmembrane domain-containing protein [Sorangium sp. So ce1182]|uniref:lysylphosphatidylglycerol synthase transmembrane domain-containing protein n=1 Tax=Sorangium sp. So ce1182 TaxID=3133334 RepID=UPI003F6011B3
MTTPLPQRQRTPPAGSRGEASSRAASWFRIALAVGGLVALVAIVRRVGADEILAALRPAVRWLPILCALELVRIACETLGSYLAFGSLAARIPRATLFRAHVIGMSLGSLAPAPRVVNETIKIGLLAPFVGAPAATSVGFINQAATLIAVGLFSIPCGLAILALGGASVWVWASVAHAAVLVATGLALQAVTRADAMGRWLARTSPRLATRAEAFRAHAIETGLWAAGPTSALMLGRCFQVVQHGIAARAVGIDAGVLGAMAAEGVHLLASAVGVLVPGGLGTTDGAFTLAAGMLDTTVARATSLALLMRCMQIVWVPIGSLVALLGPRAGAAAEPRSP